MGAATILGIVVRRRVITEENAVAFAGYALRDPSRSSRHWKWAAFQDDCEENTPLEPDRCRMLFQLGESEPGLNLGTAMMCAMLYQRRCPVELKQAAAANDRAAVRRTLRFVPRGSP